MWREGSPSDIGRAEQPIFPPLQEVFITSDELDRQVIGKQAVCTVKLNSLTSLYMTLSMCPMDHSLRVIILRHILILLLFLF